MNECRKPCWLEIVKYKAEELLISKTLNAGITFVSIAWEVTYAPLIASKVQNWFQVVWIAFSVHKTVNFWSLVCKDLEVEEGTPSTAIRKLKSFCTLLSVPLPVTQESIMLDLIAITGRNGMCLLGLAIIIAERNARWAGKEETFPFVNNLIRWLQFLQSYSQILVLRFWQCKSRQDVFVEEIADGQWKMHD